MTTDSAPSNWTRLRDRWLLAVLAAPLVVSPWGFDPSELPKLTFLRLVALGLMITGLFTVSRSAWASSKESKISVIHPLRLPIMLLLIVLGAAALRSPDPLSSLAALVDFALLAFFAFSFTGAARSREFQARAASVMVSVGALCGVWAVLQFYFADPLNGLSVQRAAGYPTGPFADTAILHGFLAAVFPLSLQQFAERQRERAGSLALTATFIIGIGLVTPGAARLPLVAAGIGGIGVAALIRRSWKPAMVVWVLPILLLFQGLTVMQVPFTGASPELRHAAARMIQTHSLKGWGPGAFGLIVPHYTGSETVAFHEPNAAPENSPRCELLTLGVEGGIPSVLAFAWIVAGAARILFRRLSRSDPSADSALAAGWAGFIVAWLFQSFDAPRSIALGLAFWCVLGLASTAASDGVSDATCTPWPKPLRWAGVAIVALLLVPLPKPEFGDYGWRSFSPSILAQSQPMPGPGAAVRWMIGDCYFGRAIRARDSADWDTALAAHLSALKWAPSRIGNWLGFGNTAYEALGRSNHRPFDWVQFGQLSYYRAQLLEPSNGFAFFGEARLLTLAVRKGRKDLYRDASRDYQMAELLYPGLAVIPFEAGVLEESMGHVNKARDCFGTSARLGNQEADARLKGNGR